MGKGRSAAGWLRGAGVEDYKEPIYLCETCWVCSIQYMHIMEHPDHPSLLMCCGCAGALDMFHETRMCENDCKWLAHRWTISAKGNPYRHVADYHIVVFASDGEWGGLISNRDGFLFTERLEKSIFLDNKYPTADAAKLALLELLRRMTHGAVDDIFEPEGRVDEVAKWLKSFLADGPKLREELVTAAQSKGYSVVMIRRAWLKTASSDQPVDARPVKAALRGVA